MSGRVAPIIAGLVGVATGVYIFQPLVLEQLQKDGALKPNYGPEEKRVESALGDLTDPTQAANNPEYKPAYVAGTKSEISQPK